MARGRRAQGPSGPSLLREVRREAARGWTPGLTVLTGDDLYHLDAAQRSLLATLVPAEATDFALTVFGEAKVDVSKVVAAARSLGMFAPRRVVLVREIAALEGEPEALVSYASGPPPDSHLLVRAPDLDRRRKLHQALVRSGRVLEFCSAADAGLETEVRSLATEKGLEIDTDAAAFLGQICAGDFYRIDGELEKLSVWIGDGSDRRVDRVKVQEVAAGSGLLSGWEVADAVLERDRPAALAALRRLLECGDEPLRVLGGLAFRARAMLQAKAMIEQGASSGQAFRAARLWGVQPGRISAGLARYGLDELLRFPGLLLEADRTLKSRAMQPGAVLESLVDKLTAPAAPRTERG